MKKKNLPKAPAFRMGSGISSDISPTALSRWESDVKASTEEDNAINILGAIGEDFWGEGITARSVTRELKNIGSDKNVVVNINSPGGSVLEGLAIYNIFREHKGEVTVKVLGIAGSIASIVAMAGDKIEIAKSGFIMIHNSFVAAIGDRHDMRDIADWLENFDNVLASVYEARSNLDLKAIAKMMDAETWIGGDDAVKDGFADNLLPRDAVTKDANAKIDLPYNAGAKIEALLAKAGTTRSERKRLLATYKSGTHNAADDTMHNAGVNQGLASQLSLMSIK